MECPRAGFVLLGAEDEHTYVVRTICKTWGCRGCGTKVRALTALKMVYGCLVGGLSYFITVTYRVGLGSELRSAPGAGRDWARLWELLKRKERWAKAAWFKVPELTGQGQVHFHALVTMMEGGSTASCRTQKERIAKTWLKTCRRGNRCMEHDISVVWHGITGDSFVCDVSGIRSLEGVANYVQKYMGKTMFERAELEGLGFRRRWSASRNWPRGAQLRLRGTEEGAWLQVTVVSAKQLREQPWARKWHGELAVRAEEDSGKELVQSVGTDLGLELQRKRITGRTRAIMRKVQVMDA